MKLSTMIVAIVGAVVPLAPQLAVAQTFDHGISAYRADEHDRARTIWLELAERGEAKAQTALGFLYMTGLRVERNEREAARWFLAAAAQGDADAQYYLGTLHLDGRGVDANPATAHFWCELAISSGAGQLLQPAYACSERAARALTREQIGTIRVDVVRWHTVPATTGRRP